MAYGIIYKLRAETQKYKDDVKINILKLDYAGAQYDKYLGAGGVTLTKDDAGVKRAVDTAWALARQIVEPQLQALASSQFCRRDPFYVPTGDFAGVRVTREMIERLLLGDTLSLLMS